MKFLNDGKKVEQEVAERPSGEIVSEMTTRNENKPVEKLSLATYLKAGYSLIYIRTEEDQRAVEMVKEAINSIMAMRNKIIYAEWKSTTGLLLADSGTLEFSGEKNKVANDLVGALKYVVDNVQSEDDTPYVLVCHNVRQFMQIPQVVQQLKDTALYSRLFGCHIILVGANIDIPPELQSLVTVYDLDLPTQKHFTEAIKSLTAAYSALMEEEPTDRTIQIVSASAVGMTELQGENAVALSISAEKKLNPKIIQVEKEQAIKRNEVLEFVHNKESMNDLGGFDRYKSWIEKRADSFSPEAIEFGLRFPKGVLMVGVPGCGKSLCARATSFYLGIPLLKMDVGRIFTSLQGSSEARVRSSLKTAEAVAPVVLWVEEIDKSMAGSQSSGQTDSGTTARVMSTILTWMQENRKPVFIFATANNVEALPPELLRKGRFTEIWGVVEPNAIEREEIWKIHLGKVRPDSFSDFDYPQLIQASSGFTGAEIEGIVEEGLFDAWHDGRREMITDDLTKALQQIIPQSNSCKDRINAIREWMKSKTRLVSSKMEIEQKSTSKVDKAYRKIREQREES